MTKKKTDITEYITAHESAQLLTLKHGRPIQPGYIHRIQGVRRYRLNKTSLLYSREDILAASVRQRSIVDNVTNS